MSRGILIHAHNNAEIDYGTMALCSAMLVKRHLRFNSTALVTDGGTLDWIKQQHGSLVDRAFDHVEILVPDHLSQDRTFHDTRYSSKILPYHNKSRVSSYDLSPFDETILMDADYLVLDDSLDQAWASVESVLVNRHVIDLMHRSSPGGFDERFNDMGIPLYWATLLYFRKDPVCKSLFDLMKFIKENFDYYQRLYQFAPSGYFRNDYALSIALHMIYGQFENDSINAFPMEHMLVATEYDDLVGFKNGTAYFVSEHSQGDFKLHQVTTNIHVMNKWSITRMASRILDYACLKS